MSISTIAYLPGVYTDCVLNRHSSWCQPRVRLRDNSVATLSTFAALDVRTVIEEERNDAGIQVDDSYFRGQELAMNAIGTASTLPERQKLT